MLVVAYALVSLCLQATGYRKGLTSSIHFNNNNKNNWMTSSVRSCLVRERLHNNKNNNNNNYFQPSKRLSLSMSTGDDFYPNMDAYQVLEVPRSADKKDIKAAYRKMVSKW